MKQNNPQQNKNTNKKGKRVEIFFVVSILIYLAVTIPLLCLVEAFTVHWFIFGLAFILIPFGVLNFFAWGASKTQLTSGQMILATKRICILTGYLWLLDAFYMCIFNNWTVAIWCVGTTIVIINSIGLINNFLGKVKILKRFIPFDLIITISIGIYLIYIIPNAQLQQIITTVASAFLGGALTLVGVAWTIRRQDEIRKQDAEHREKERREEEKKKSKPYFTINMVLSSPLIHSGDKICFNDTPPGIKKYGANCEIQNSNQSVFTIKRVFNDDKWEEMLGNNVLLPSMKIVLAIDCDKFFGKYLEVEDILGNLYYYEFKILMITDSKTQNIVYTMNYLKEVQYSEIEKTIS